MSTRPPHRARCALGVRAAAAILTVVLGMVAIACRAPSKTSDTGTTSGSPSTTAIDPGAGPTSITRSLRATEVVGGLDQPTAMANRPMRNQLWVTERAGRLRVVQIGADWNMETGQSVRGGARMLLFPVLDISGDVSLEGDRGLLGIAFSTDGRTVFLDYVNRRGDIVVASWTVTDPPPQATTTTTPDPQASTTTQSSTTTTTGPPRSTTSSSIVRDSLPPPVVDGGSRRVLLQIPHDGTSNYGGQLALGRDGFLYVGVGDSTRGTTDRNAQNPDSLLGKVLRIDPAGATATEPYSIPSSNPYAGGGGAAQVFLLGVQNPLRFSFDRANGDLWLGDAGARRTQEIDLLTAASGGGRGANLGWPDVAGTTASGGDTSTKYVAPILAFDSANDGCPVIGGYVYRGSAISNLQGVYLYGDRCSGEISGVLQRRGRVLDKKAMGPRFNANTLASFGQDDQGELYVVLSSGSLQRLVAQ